MNQNAVSALFLISAHHYRVKNIGNECFDAGGCARTGVIQPCQFCGGAGAQCCRKDASFVDQHGTTDECKDAAGAPIGGDGRHECTDISGGNVDTL